MLTFEADRPLDLICLGRANIDLYAIERGKSLRDTTGFIKAVGGSPANIAVAASRLGMKSGLISQVSDDQLGQFVVDYLAGQGVDTRCVSVDSSGQTRTSIAFAEVKPQNCDVLFYRKDASDLQLRPQDIDEQYIRSAKALLISGTALSGSPSREAVFTAIAYARQSGVAVFFDLDFRTSAWSNQYDAQIYYLQTAQLADVIIGNKEEFEVMRQDTASLTDDTGLFGFHAKLIVLKNGAEGSTCFRPGLSAIKTPIYPVEVLKPYGAGDAFAGALINSLLRQIPLEEALRHAAAAGAIVVSRESCTEAMPTLAEIEAFML